MVSNNKDVKQTIEVKIGNIVVPLKVAPGLEMYYELIANEVNEKYKSIKETNPDTIQSYALTALQIAAGQVEIEQKLEEKVENLRSTVSSLIERLENILPTNFSSK